MLRAVTFEWDPRKAAVNRGKHNISFEDASTVFLDPLAMTYADPDHSRDESREIPIGSTIKGLVVVVSHCERKAGIRIISARRATRNEQRHYEQKEGS